MKIKYPILEKFTVSWLPLLKSTDSFITLRLPTNLTRPVREAFEIEKKSVKFF